MKLEFVKGGKPVTVEADDESLSLVEIKQGADEFVMLRFAPGSLNVSVPPDSHTWRL